MPPPPVLRLSPAREGRLERRHKRGRSVESALQDRGRDKDDDLALFQDMETKERDNFLHHSGSDSDESISLKLRGFSEYRLSISTPANRESSDLLTNDMDKNDYDWLLTPPDTPLFPSLDDETPPVNLSQRGRPRAQPLQISRASRMETSSRVGRSSASPRRSSPSSGSSCINAYSRRKASPGPSASVSPTLRSLTPSVKPSTPTSKCSTPSIRSTTPTLRRSSTGSGSSMGRGGSSSGKANRGNSSSPKLKAWHADHPEFAAEPPPNLRTSISDRPVSSTRGSSPASRRGLSPASSRGLSPASRRGLSPASGHGVEAGIVSRRQSVSPTFSRSPSSSNSHDRDRLSSQSKGSAVSSCEDEIDSVQSTFSGKKRTSNESVVGRPITRRQEPYPHSRIQPFSKKTTRSTAINMSIGSVPKRTFDPALRQMDIRRNSQSMFRPLLSSVPATSFYATKANSVQRRTYSMNSSVTTSSNASSEQGASVAPDTEGSDHDQDEIRSEWDKSLFPHVQEDVLVVDKMEVKAEVARTHSIGISRQQEDDPEHDGTANSSGITDIQLDTHDESNFSERMLRDSNKLKDGEMVLDINGKNVESVIDDGISNCCTNLNNHLEGMVDAEVTVSDSQRRGFILNRNGDSGDGSFVDIQEDVPGKNPIHDKDNNVTRRNLQATLRRDLETDSPKKLNCTTRRETVRPQSTVKQDNETCLFPLSQPVESGSRHMQDRHPIDSVGEVETQIATDKLMVAKLQDNVYKFNGIEDITRHEIGDDLQCFTGKTSRETHGKFSFEGKDELLHGSTGSKTWLIRASSCKWPVVQAKAVNTSDLPEEGCCLRRSLNDLKSVRNEEYTSTSQSLDACLTRQTERRLSRHMSIRKLDTDNFTTYSNIKVSSALSTSGIRVQNDSFQSPVHGGNVATNVGDSIVKVFERTNTVPASALEHIASEKPPSRHQSDISESQVGNDFIESDLPTQNNNAVTEIGMKMKEALESEIMIKEQCCLSNTVSNMEKRDQKYVCNGNCDFFENRCSCSQHLAEDAVVDKKEEVAQSSGLNRENGVDDYDLLPDRNDDYLHSSLDLVVSKDENINWEKSPHGLHENDKSSQIKNTVSPIDQYSSDMPTEPSVSSTPKETSHSQDMTLKHPEPDICQGETINVFQEEHTIKADAPRGYLSRNLTLEEATDTILFCSSIVHNLAYKAATIAMEKENHLSIEVPRPMVTIVGKPETDLRNSCAGAAGRRKPKSQKIKSRQTTPHVQASSNNIETNLKNQKPVVHVVTIPECADTVKPSTINSKCNCTIM